MRLVREGEFPRNETVLINLTGNDLEIEATQGRVQWLVRSGDDWVVEGSRQVESPEC